MDEEFKKWDKRLWETRGNRFIAARRLESHDNWSTITITVVSVYIIFLNLAVFYPEKPVFLTDNLITIITISLSALVLGFSNIITSKNYSVQANNYLECGREISYLLDKISLWESSKKKIEIADFELLSQNYKTILDKYNLNHSSLDFLLFQAENHSHYNLKTFFVIKTKLIYFLSTYFWYFLFIATPLILFFWNII